MKTNNHIYLYLAARNKRGVKLLTVISGEHILPIRLDDVKNLGLPLSWQVKIDELIHINRMHWEPWLESAVDFQTLRLTLRKRGYSNLPIHSTPLLDQTDLLAPPLANTKALKKPKIMIQKR